MTRQYDQTNRAVLFKNENKKTENHPDYTGSLNFEGVDCFLDAWVKTAESGRKFMSLSVKRKEKQAAPAPRQAAPAPRQAPSHDAARSRQLDQKNYAPSEYDSDIPF